MPFSAPASTASTEAGATMKNVAAGGSMVMEGEVGLAESKMVETSTGWLFTAFFLVGWTG